MNEDIVKKLIKQATEEVLGVKQVDQKLYTELVVKECTDVINDGQFLHDEAPTAIFAKECTAAINRHFGLDE
jgi:ABC-type lipopolysaccharide export system ATPase subunit